MLNKLLSRLVTHNGTPIRKASRHVSCIDMDRPDRLPSAHLKSGHRFGWRQGILPGRGRFLIFFSFCRKLPSSRTSLRELQASQHHHRIYCESAGEFSAPRR